MTGNTSTTRAETRTATHTTKGHPAMTTTTAERQYIIVKSDLDETYIASKPSLAQAEREAQAYADRHATKVYISWNADNGMTVCRPVESRATADYLHTFAANDYETYETCFLPIARRVEEMRTKGKTRERITEIMTPRANNWAAFASIRHAKMLTDCYDFPMKITADTERQAAQDMLAYILDELDAGNSWS